MSEYTGECLFCKFIKREIEPTIIYENDYVLAFLDITPAGTLEGHTLVLPKKHFENIYEMDEEYLGHVIKAVQKIAIAVKKASRADGINILQNNGKIAGQGIMHVHFHIIPRARGDGIIIDENRRNMKPMEALEVSKAIRKEL